MIRPQLILLALLSSQIHPETAKAEEAPYTIFSIGGAPTEAGQDTLKAFARRLAEADPASSAVVFTGNYSSEGPMPPEGDPKRAQVEADVRRHVDVVRVFANQGGKVIFLPGQMDFQGPETVRRLQAFIDRELFGEKASETAMPVTACGDPVLFNLNKKVVLALLNSQWWMQDFDAHPLMNEECTVKVRGKVPAAVNDIVKRWRASRLVFAMHHPIESRGPYGGRFPAGAHFVPPIAASLSIWARQSGLVPQHLSHVRYDAFAGSVFAAAQKFGGFTFVSGHEKSLQLVYKKDQAQIVTGSAGETSRVVGPGKRGFTARKPGWAELHLGTDADTVSFHDGMDGAELHVAGLPEVTRFGSDDLGPPPPIPEGEVASTYAKKKFSRTGAFKSFFLGDHYRDAYTLELLFPVLDLEEEGFKPFSAGGGNQTNSLFLFGPQGGQWVARSTTKDAGRFLPYPLNQLGFVNSILEDAFTATHPSAAEAVPPLAEAAGVFHTSPELRYLPDQKAQEPYRGFITEEVVLLERRAKRPKNGTLPERLGEGASPVGETGYKGSDDLLELLREEPWLHRVDQEAMLRARLLDIFIGDWDRHEDQWRFARLEYPDGHFEYRPIPEDRDQAFSHYDGFALAFGRLLAPEIRVLRPFKKRIRGLSWLIYGSRHWDPILLNGLDEETWMKAAREVQTALTDEVIDRAMKTWPEPAYELDGKEIAEKLRGRRDDLVKAAEKYYRQLNRKVDVLGSESADDIRITFMKGGDLRLQITHRESGGTIFDRTFFKNRTKEIRLYALGGDDHLTIDGEPHRKIKIRFVGGTGEDLIRSEGDQKRRAKAIQLYDRGEGAKIEDSAKVRDRRTEDAYRNQYDRYDPHNEPFTMAFIPGFNVNPDDGVLLGGTFIGTATGFKREPFDSRHTVSFDLSTATLGVSASYQAFLPNTLLRTLDQTLFVGFTSDRFTRNFFGATNDYVDPRIAGRDFFRLRQLQGIVRYGPSLRLAADTVTLGLQVTGQIINTQDTEGRIVRVSPDVQADALEDRYYVGGRLRFAVDTRSNSTYPKRGFTFEGTADLRTDLTSFDDFNTSVTLRGAIGTHLPLDPKGRIVITTRARVAHVENIEGDVFFYWLPSLGSNDLRGFNDEQFTGDTVFSQTTDLRIELLRIRRGLPGNLGIAGSIDHGRAFFGDVVGDADPINRGRDEYHVSAGGTLYWNLFGLFGLAGSYHRALFDDSERIVIGIGPQFAATGFVPN
ncbi:MAG: hypothetical protein AAF627_14250 [Myxococcota bacterium]